MARRGQLWTPLHLIHYSLAIHVSPRHALVSAFFQREGIGIEEFLLIKKILADATADFSLIPFLWIYLDFSCAISNVGSIFSIRGLRTLGLRPDDCLLVPIAAPDQLLVNWWRSIETQLLLLTSLWLFSFPFYTTNNAIMKCAILILVW